VLLTLAVIGPAHALKGEVRLEIRTDDPEGRLAPGTTVPTEPAHAGPLTVSRLRFDGFRWFAAFEQARDRTAAEALRGVRRLVVVDDERPPRAGCPGCRGERPRRRRTGAGPETGTDTP